jgi:hypothetical protein
LIANEEKQFAEFETEGAADFWHPPKADGNQGKWQCWEKTP